MTSKLHEFEIRKMRYKLFISRLEENLTTNIVT